MNWSPSCNACSETSSLSDGANERGATFTERRLVIMSAPNGARRLPSAEVGVPVTAGELAACADALIEQSVAVLHMHVRDDNYRHTLDVDRYRDAMAAVRDRIGNSMIIQVTTEAVGIYHAEQQMSVVRELRPEAVSLALRELCPDASAESAAGTFFEWLVAERIWPQYILYSVDDLQRFDEFRRKGFFAEERPFCMLVLGKYADGSEGQVEELAAMLNEVDCTQFPWAVCCFGRNENAAALHADHAGGHIRLGFENNVMLQDGDIAADNAALVAQFHTSRQRPQRPAATAEEIRNEWLGAR